LRRGVRTRYSLQRVKPSATDQGAHTQGIHAQFQDPASDSIHAPAHEFTTTHWSVVLRAGQADSSEARHALDHLCRDYWYPLYAHVRRQGRSVEDAQDITQEFFLRLLSHDYVRLADPQRGRFRTFLLTSLDRFMVNEWQKSTAAKRGGGAPAISLDAEAAEHRYQAEPADGLSPDRLFQKRWAVTLLEQVLHHLGVECEAAGKQDLFNGLRPHIFGEPAVENPAALAMRLGMTDGALRVTLHRLRERYRELLRAEVARTVATPDEVDAELRELVAALRE
jgi:DNA-directed RNA polymerase specialized sigma24 family protein